MPNTTSLSIHSGLPVYQSGKSIDDAKAAIIMIHGRGATAESILSLASEFTNKEIAYIAPQAFQNSWYPFSFLQPIKSNEPYLSSALSVIDNLVVQLINKNYKTENIFLLGFSQGACLTLEYAARNPKKFGGIFGLSGGLIGPPDTPRNYSGSFNNTTIFLGCSNIDPHIPKERVDETEEVFLKMNASVTKKIYEGMAHTIIQDEIDFINAILNSK